MSATAGDQLGTADAALANAMRLLRPRPDLAAEQAREIIAASPRHGRAHFALGLALAAQGDHTQAVAALRRATALERQRRVGRLRRLDLVLGGCNPWIEVNRQPESLLQREAGRDYPILGLKTGRKQPNQQKTKRDS